jgi:ATP phosphoribosyltransferase regulatory subunit
MSSLTKIPAGVQYFFDEEVKLRRSVERRAMEVFDGWSYDEIILPMFDYHNLFARGMGEEKATRTYRFVDRDGGLLALRPELTSLVARTVATRFKEKARPVRLCYSGEVFRYDEPSERASREFHQIGVEHIGEPNIVADVEVLLVAAELLGSLGLGEFRIALSHVDFFNGAADFLKLNDGERARFRELIDRRNSLALDEFLDQQAGAVDLKYRREFSRLVRIAGRGEALETAQSIPGNERSHRATRYMAEIYSILISLGLDAHFDIDWGEAGGLEYYTGLTFKVFTPGWGAAIGGGGRYDNLIANFGDAEPAVGFSFALDSLAGAIARKGGAPGPEKGEAAQSIGAAGSAGGGLIESFRLAREQRAKEKKVKICVQ